MIKLIVEDYCHDCPYFEIKVAKGDVCDVNIYCAHRLKCLGIADHIAASMKKEKKRGRTNDQN